MVWTGLLALISHWRRQPVQLALLLLSLSLATALWSAVQAINGEARASYDRAAAILGQDQLAQLLPEDGARMHQQEFVELRRAGWLVSPVIKGEMRFGDVRLRVLGIDPLTLPPQAQQVNFGAGDGLSGFGLRIAKLALEQGDNVPANSQPQMSDSATMGIRVWRAIT